MTSQRRDEPVVTLEMHMFFLGSLKSLLSITSRMNFFSVIKEVDKYIKTEILIIDKFKFWVSISITSDCELLGKLIKIVVGNWQWTRISSRGE